MLYHSIFGGLVDKVTVLITLIVVTHEYGCCTAAISSLLDISAVSAVVAGLMIVLLYEQNGWFGLLLQAANIKIIFAPSANFKSL